VVISLLLNRLINDRGFDEEQILRKGVPFLPAEHPEEMEEVTAFDLCDPRSLPRWASEPLSEGILHESILPEDHGGCLLGPGIFNVNEEESFIKKELKAHPKIHEFAIVNESRGCVGFTLREWLDAALQAKRNIGVSDGSNASDGVRSVSDEFPLTPAAAKRIVEADSPRCDALIPVERLSAGAPYMIASSMPAVRFYSMFVQGCVRMAAVVSPDGKYCGMITRSSLIASTRRAAAARAACERNGLLRSILLGTFRSPATMEQMGAEDKQCRWCRAHLGHRDHIFWECLQRPPGGPERPKCRLQARLGWPMASKDDNSHDTDEAIMTYMSMVAKTVLDERYGRDPSRSGGNASMA